MLGIARALIEQIVDCEAQAASHGRGEHARLIEPARPPAPRGRWNRYEHGAAFEPFGQHPRKCNPELLANITATGFHPQNRRAQRAAISSKRTTSESTASESRRRTERCSARLADYCAGGETTGATRREEQVEDVAGDHAVLLRRALCAARGRPAKEC